MFFCVNNFFTTEHRGVHKNSFRNASAFQVRIEIWKCQLVFEERGKSEYPEKNLLEQSREQLTNITQI